LMTAGVVFLIQSPSGEHCCYRVVILRDIAIQQQCEASCSYLPPTTRSDVRVISPHAQASCVTLAADNSARLQAAACALLPARTFGDQIARHVRILPALRTPIRKPQAQADSDQYIRGRHRLARCSRRRCSRQTLGHRDVGRRQQCVDLVVVLCCVVLCCVTPDVLTLCVTGTSPAVPQPPRCYMGCWLIYWHACLMLTRSAFVAPTVAGSGLGSSRMRTTCDRLE
jgi:hypothetical protein